MELLQAVHEKWTRDLFDRLIVANAKAAGALLISKDERIHKHYRDTIRRSSHRPQPFSRRFRGDIALGRRQHLIPHEKLAHRRGP